MHRRTFLFTIPLLASSALRALPPPVQLELVVEKQLQSPTTITHAGDGSGRLFIAEQRGLIRIMQNGMLLPAPFLDLSAQLVQERPNFDERGLLGLAFHPDYETASAPGYRRFYVFYTAPSPNFPGTPEAPVDCRSVVAEYRVSSNQMNVADAGSARILLEFDKPQFNHNGGQLAFGPDGLLYISTGDGGSSNDNAPGHAGGSSLRPTGALGNAQDLTNLMGKILRIDPLADDGPGGGYGIPAGNPYAGNAPGRRGEIFAYGLRNPWRFSFDEMNGRLFVADVGQGSVEEVNLVTIGGNYGWRNREGTFTPAFATNAPAASVVLTDPIAQYAHPGVTIGSPALPQIGVSITGGNVYLGNAIPALRGTYVFADWSQNGSAPLGTLMGLEERSGGAGWDLSVMTVEGGNPIPWFINALGVDEDGEMYLAVKKVRSVSALDGGFPAGGLLKMVPVPTPVEASLDAAADNTIYSAGEFANGAGTGLFAGSGGQGGERRALLRFDPTSLPTNATVLAASLRMFMDQGKPAANDLALHRLTASWGEGSSIAPDGGGGGGAPDGNDATFTKRFSSGANWATAGGDFVASASATTTVTVSEFYVWDGAGVAEDVRQWLSDPTDNNGWLLKSTNGAAPAKRFGSRESGTGASRPRLTVRYLENPVFTRRQAWIRQHYFAGQFVDETGDEDGDHVPTLLEYAFDQDPGVADRAGRGIRVDGAVALFLRDPRATDLVYILQASDRLQDGWSDIATSTGGSAATGPDVLGESAAGDNPTLREVRVRIGGAPVRYVRLLVQRGAPLPP